MKKSILPFLVLIMFLFAACGQAAEKKEALTEQAVTFTDDLGRTVSVGSPERTAVLLGSFAQIWMLAGGEVCAAPDDAWEDLGLELSKETVNLGNTKNLSLELLLSSEPDFILASTNTRQNMEWLDTLDGTDIPIAYFDVTEFEDYLNLLKICTDITGKPELYEKYGTKVQEQINAVCEQNRQRTAGQESPTVLCLVASASTARAKNSDGSVLGAILKVLGCENIADSDAMILENLSIEHILVSDPDYIFIVQRGDDEEGMRQYVKEFLMEDPAWKQLTAVQNEHVYFMEKNLFNLKPNERWGEAYEIVEEILKNG